MVAIEPDSIRETPCQRVGRYRALRSTRVSTRHQRSSRAGPARWTLTFDDAAARSPCRSGWNDTAVNRRDCRGLRGLESSISALTVKAHADIGRVGRPLSSLSRSNTEVPRSSVTHIGRRLSKQDLRSVRTASASIPAHWPPLGGLANNPMTPATMALAIAISAVVSAFSAFSVRTT